MQQAGIGRSTRIRAGAVCVGAAMLAGSARADVAPSATEEGRIAELERRVEVLTAEVENNRFGDIFRPVGESRHGMGPAASKVYAAAEGVTLGGYGEALYQNRDGSGGDEADFYRAILYAGYKYNERWVLNTEVEFEHASTGEEGEVSVEFAYLDYLYRPELNVRSGLVLLPVGIVNELHEPVTFFGARRPDVESRIIPTTWRENGVGIFGELGRLAYKAYVVNGLEASDFTAAGIRDGRQNGSKANAEDLAGVGRVDLDAGGGLTLGGSAYYGNSGQDLDVSAPVELYEIHGLWRRKALQVRALGALGRIGDAAELNALRAESAADGTSATAPDAIGEQQVGWYVEAGYDLASLLNCTTAIIPFVRYEEYDTQDKVPDGYTETGTYDIDVVTAGVNVKPIAELVFKADYQFYDARAGEKADQLNVAMGYVF